MADVKQNIEKNDIVTVDLVSPSTGLKAVENPTSGQEDALIGGSVPEEVPRRVKFKELFRYATALDMLLMFIGIVSAAAAGTAHPFITVVFGNLVNTFSVTPSSPVFANLTLAEREVFTNTWRQNFLVDVRTNTLYFLYLAAFTFVTTYIYMGIFVATGERITYRMREKYLWAVLRQDITWHEAQGAGEVATRITSDMLLIQDAVSEKVPIAFYQIFTFIGSFAISFYRSYRLTFVLLSVVPLIVLAAGAANILGTRFQRSILTSYAKAGTVAEECISSIRTVSALNAQTRMLNRYSALLDPAVKLGIKKSVITGAGTGIVFMFMYLMYALAFYYGSVLLQTNEISAGDVVNVFFAILTGAFALGQIAPEMQAFSLGVGAGSKILATLDRVPDIDAIGAPKGDGGTTETEQLKRCKGNIRFNDVDFNYPSRPDVSVLTKFNLTFEAGATTALVGLSGSGKSTIIQLIERFYDPKCGSIELDGQNLTTLSLLWLRRQIGLVSQEPILFDGTIAGNVARGLIGTPNEKASEEAQLELVKQACILANAHEFVMRLPNGYSTQVGDRGFMLSGGQKQRIAIARAIIKNPQILLLDEATSALDTVSERIVQQALDNASKGRTTIVIAHRLSTVRSADRIVVMSKGGVIVESGSHDELMKMESGVYRGLVEAQQLKTVEDEERKEEDPDAALGAEQDMEDGECAAEGHRRESVALELGEAGKSRIKPITMWRIIKEVYLLSKPELVYTIPGLISAMIAGLVIPIFAIVFSSVIQAFAAAEPQRTRDIRFWASMFVVMAAVTAITNIAQNTLFGIANERLTDRLRRLLFSAILHQDLSFFSTSLSPIKPTKNAPAPHSTGSLSSNLSTDSQKLQGASGITLGTSLQLLSTLLGGAIISLFYGWKLALVGITVLPLLVIAGAFRVIVLTHFSEKAEKAHARSAQVCCEGVAGIRSVQALTAEGWVHERYVGMLKGPVSDGCRSAVSSSAFYAVSQCMNFLGLSLVFWYGGQLIAYENYQVQDFFVVFVAVIFGSISAGRIFAFIPDVTKARSAGQSIFTILDRTPLIDINAGVSTKSIIGRIELKDVVFGYTGVKVLNGLSLSVEPGQFVALVGGSGCGKSTVLGLLERFYDVEAGSVEIDGRDLRSMNLKDLRANVGIVAQEPGLFDMSIEENILLGLHTDETFVSEGTDPRVVEAAKDANIHDFILSLPEGYKTVVGVRGSKLSGGQKQRIAIARALMAQPKILLLDEATSALDAESERVVQEALDMAAAKGRTTVAVAHRLSSIQGADVIFVVKKGRVVEQGTHRELCAMKGVYYQLAVQQNVDVPVA